MPAEPGPPSVSSDLPLPPRRRRWPAMLGLYAAVLFVAIGAYFYIVQLRKNADQGRRAQILLAQLDAEVQREHAIELAGLADAGANTAVIPSLTSVRSAISTDLSSIQATIGPALTGKIAAVIAVYERSLDDERNLVAAAQPGPAQYQQQQGVAPAFTTVQKTLTDVTNAVASQTHTSLQRADFGILLALMAAVATVSVAFGSFWRARREADETAMRDLATRLKMERALQEQLTYQALTDALTELPNRSLFMDRVEHALTSAAKHWRGVAIFFLDMDHFKDVNDTLGHLAGDQLLIAVARRLRDSVRAQDTVARLGGDEFALLLEDVSGEDGAARVAEELIERFRKPFIVDQHELFVTTSIGVAVAAAGGVSTRDVVRQADVALYRAKAEGRSCAVIFHPSMDEQNRDRLLLESGLRHAIDRGELFMQYQPLVNLRTGTIAGLEALARWRHPERGLISPTEFVPIAEESGQIVPIGEWILRESCEQLARWRRLFPALNLMMSVNVSVRQFHQNPLADQVASILRETGVPPSALELEITESMFMQHIAVTAETLHALKEYGVRFAIDDFGTGYSAMGYLASFPVDTIKIDQSFVRTMMRERATRAIVEATIALAHALAMRVTAEGVEGAEQAARLRALGCDGGQGNFFCPASSAPAIERYLERDNARLSRALSA